jgi:PAS domain S-box-containing protein
MKTQPLDERLPSTQPEPRAATFLIVDDSAEDRQRLRVVLEGMGHAVIEVSNSQQALAEARRTRPDIILSDIHMPGADGFELCRRLQQDPDLRHVPFVFVTAAYSAPQYQKFAQDVGAVRVLSKPLKPEELRAAIEESLIVGVVPGQTQKLRRLDNEAFHKRHSKVLRSQLKERMAELERVGRLYKVLSQTNKAIVRITSREQLFPAICSIAVEYGGLRLAAITLIDQADRHPNLVAWHGEPTASRNELQAALDEFHATGQDLTGEALRSGTPVISNDFLNNSTTTPWHEAARRAGIGALAAYPFRENGAVAGALELYAREPRFFTAEMLQALEEMAADISFALGNYAREAERNRAKQAAADALDYTRLLIASSAVGILTYKATGTAVSANAAAARIVGGTEEQLKAQNFREIESWKQSGLLSLAEQALATNRAVQKEIHIPATTFGNNCWFVARLAPFEYNSERHLLAVLSDITERIRAEQVLRDKDQLLSETQRIAQVGGWIYELTGEVSWSEEMYRIYGVSPATVIPTLEFALNQIHPEDRQAMQTWIAAGVAGQRLDELQFRIVRPDGTVRFVLGRGELRHDADNRPLRMIGTAEDITERKRAHEALDESEGKYRALVEQQSLVGIFLFDGEKVLYQNPRADEIFGYKPGELVGHPVKSLVADEDWPMVEREFPRLLSGEIPFIKRDFRGRRKDGREVIINAHSTRARSGGRPVVIGVLQDVTDQRRAEQKSQDQVAQLEVAFMHTVEVATRLGEMRDPYTAGHERRVAEIAVAISAELGFDARRQQGLRIAGYLHDIGKITIPLEILSKPGRLNAAEFALVKGHPQASYDILKDVEFPWPVAQVALQHHERMDGSGYPQGLKGEAILFEARVMAVADTIEAMASHRPYRPGLGVDKALVEIERGRGSAYDPIVVDACLKLFREKGYQLPQT